MGFLSGDGLYNEETEGDYDNGPLNHPPLLSQADYFMSFLYGENIDMGEQIDQIDI